MVSGTTPSAEESLSTVQRVSLHSTTYGDRGPWVVFCHGLFGQGKNWTQVAKSLTSTHRVLLLDMPNHGRSPWTDRFDYIEAAAMVADQLPADAPVTLVGHSMGGKIAMLVALQHPHRIDRLAVVDVSPVSYHHGREFAAYIETMRALGLTTLSRRAEADEALREVVSDPVVRGFLLQNLHRDHGTWRWQPNLAVLGRDLEQVTGWPVNRLPLDAHYLGPVLWIAGADSNYVRPEYAAEMERLFPKVRRVTIKGAGHWVHSEQPEVFGEVLRRFVAPAD